MGSDQKKTKKTLKRPNKPIPSLEEVLEQTKESERSDALGEHKPLQEKNQTQREFLFETFHEMYNPLHAIMGYASLVLRKTKDQIPEKHQENLGKIILSAERLKEIVDRMVAFYREK